MMIEILAATDVWTMVKEAVPVVMGLIIIEGLLSVDNALAIAAMASHLEPKQQKMAMNIGYAGAYGFRIVALFMTGFIMANTWLMLLGSAYLIWLMCAHFAEQEEAAPEEGAVVNVSHHSFGATVAMIALMDLSLSFDNVVAAVAFARDQIWLVYLGVTLGIITLRLVAGYCIKLLKKEPWLEHTAFLLVGFVGLLLLVELWTDSHFPKAVKFGGIFSIIGLHLAYEKTDVMKVVLRPVLRVLLLPAEIVAGVIGAVFLAVSWPFRAAWGKLSAGRGKN